MMQIKIFSHNFQPAAAVASARLGGGRAGEPVVEAAAFAILVLLASSETLRTYRSECELAPHLDGFNCIGKTHG